MEGHLELRVPKASTVRVLRENATVDLLELLQFNNLATEVWRHKGLTSSPGLPSSRLGPVLMFFLTDPSLAFRTMLKGCSRRLRA